MKMPFAAKDATLTAKVILLGPSIGGRQSPPPVSGYRGQFFYNNADCDALHYFDVEGEVPFGIEVIDHICLVNAIHRARVRERMMFLIREGNHTIGYGYVIEVHSPVADTIGPKGT